MNKKYTSLVLAGLMCFSSITPAFAYDLDENKNSIESVEYQNTNDADYSNQTNVFAELGSEYKVTIPKTIVLSGIDKKANYYVKVDGDIAGYETVNVVPDEGVVLSTKNKASQTGTITQDKTAWKFDDFDVDANGQVIANNLTAGKWSGTFNFNIYMDSHEEFVLGDLVLPPIGFDASSPAQASASQVVNAKVGDSGNIDIVYSGKDVAKDSTITSSNENVVKVDKNKLTAVNEGTSTITVDYDTSKSGNDEGIKSYSFDVKVTKDEEPITLAAGLYDENDNLIKSWDELVALGLNIEKDYSNDTLRPSDSSYYKDLSSGYSVFTNNNLSGKLVIPSSVTTIGQSAFQNCTSLTSVTIPDSITTIGSRAFYNCTSLKSITIPDSVTTIDIYTFYNCTSLKSITIPDSVTTIGANVFNKCTSLTSIEIPDSVTSIDADAFINCTSLKSVTYNGTKTQWNAIKKGSRYNYNVPTSCAVHCTDGDTTF